MLREKVGREDKGTEEKVGRRGGIEQGFASAGWSLGVCKSQRRGASGLEKVVFPQENLHDMGLEEEEMEEEQNKLPTA